MKFTSPLQSAIFIRRYKRFLVDVTLPDGSALTVHCPNTGSMTGCLAPGCEVMISRSDNQARKYPHTLELTQMNGVWVGVNTAKTNALVREALENGVVKEIGPFDTISAEVTVFPGSRLDFLLHNGCKKIYLEVKNCTLVEGEKALFPDAVTTRGTKHLNDLIRLRQGGHGAVIFYCVQRQDATIFSPASHIDLRYAESLIEAQKSGVQVLAYQAEVGPDGVEVKNALPVELPFL